MAPVDPGSLTVTISTVWKLITAVLGGSGVVAAAVWSAALWLGRKLAKYDGYDARIGVVETVQHEHSDKIHALRLDVSTRLATVEARESLHHAIGGE